MHAAADWRRQSAAAAKALIGPRATVWTRCVLRGQGVPRWGNLRRTVPFSSRFGVERGTPIDRYYLHRFLDAHRSLVSGAVLEIQSSTYTTRFGQGVRVAHSIDILSQFNPTYVCDLAACDDVVPSGRYDCFLLPNTVQHLRDLESALRQVVRIVKPGGVVLASAAGLLPLIPDGPDYWRLGADGWREITNRAWKGHDVEIEAHGNCLAATAAMLGLAVEELTPAELDVSDPRYPVLITLKCVTS